MTSILTAVAYWDLTNTQINGTIHRRDTSGTWSIVWNETNSYVTGGFAVAKNNQDVVVTTAIVGGNFDILYSTDRGATWTAGGAAGDADMPLGVAVNDAGTEIYVLHVGGSQGLYASTNWGTTWTKIADDPGYLAGGTTVLGSNIWQHDGLLYWVTHSVVSGTWHWLLARAATDGSGATSFGDTTLDTFSPNSVQMTGSTEDDTLIFWKWQERVTGVGFPSENVQHVVIRDASTTPTFDQSDYIDTGLAASSYLQSITPINTGHFLAVVEDTGNSLMVIYRSLDGVSGWTSEQSDSDPNNEANGAGATGATTFMFAKGGTTIYRPLVTPHLWASTDDGVTWTSEDIPNIPTAGMGGRAFTALAAFAAAAAQSRVWGIVIG